jgi:hypothetical protein
MMATVKKRPLEIETSEGSIPHKNEGGDSHRHALVNPET